MPNALTEFWGRVAITAMKNPDYRFGQAAFNLLYAERPWLAEQVRATNKDPFYARDFSDSRLVDFYQFLCENWV